MTHILKTGIISLASSLLFASNAFSAAFTLYEVAAPVMGTAGVGQAAFASDASTSFFNPAGMTQLKNSQVMVGGQAFFLNTHFETDDLNTLRGGNGNNAGGIYPGLANYIVYDYSPTLKFGVSLNAPYAGGVHYTEGWVGRYVAQDDLLITLDLNPSFAYQVNDWFAAGAGFSIQYAKYDQQMAMFLPGLPDGSADLELDNFALGFNLGVLLTPTPKTRIGVAYRSGFTHDLTGETAFERLLVTPPSSSILKEPQSVILSVAQQATSKLLLLGEAGWANWGVFDNTIVNIGGFSLVIPDDWHNTWRAGVGMEYQLISRLTMQFGVSYDSSPVDKYHRLPFLPMDRQIRIGTGMKFQANDYAMLSMAYEYVDFGDAKIFSPSAVGVLSGKYPVNRGNFLSMSINVNIV